MIDRSKMLHRPLPATWWLKKKGYVIFILRELSAVFVALFALATILQVRAINHGAEAYAEFTEWLASPLVLCLSVVSMAFVLLHAVTWYILAGKVLVVSLGDKRVPASLIVGAHFAGWLVVSAVIAGVVLR